MQHDCGRIFSLRDMRSMFFENVRRIFGYDLGTCVWRSKKCLDGASFAIILYWVDDITISVSGMILIFQGRFHMSNSDWA